MLAGFQNFECIRIINIEVKKAIILIRYWFLSRSLQSMKHKEIIHLSNSFGHEGSGYIQFEHTQV